MSRFGKLVLVVVLAVLPLRGMAAAVAMLCDLQPGAAVQAQASHECCEGMPTEPGAHHECGGDAVHGSCGHCATCSVGAFVPSLSTSAVLSAPMDTLSIPFLGRWVAGFVPELFDRPPLAL